MPTFECSRCNSMTYSSCSEAAGMCERCGATSFRTFDGAFEQARTAPRELGHGDHATLVYDDPHRVAPFCARYVTEGVNGGEAVFCALAAELEAAVRELLAPDVEVLVDWHDPRELYADFDADRVAGVYDSMIAAEPRTTRILAGIDGASAREISGDELDRYERLAHAIVARRAANVICVYDVQRLPPGFEDVAARRHGLAIADGVVSRNERFEYEPA